MINRIEHHLSRYIIPPSLKKSMNKDQELIVITKTYDLILWSCNHTSKYPRNHRFVLGERIERNLRSARVSDPPGVPDPRSPVPVRRRLSGLSHTNPSPPQAAVLPSSPAPPANET